MYETEITGGKVQQSRGREVWNGGESVMKSQLSVADTNPGHVDVVIIGQRVQHFHHWRFDQFQGESTDTAAPEETHKYHITCSDTYVGIQAAYEPSCSWYE